MHACRYRETASFFDALLKERAASTPMEQTFEQKVGKMKFLQRELEYVVSSGLASDRRRKWVAEKTALEIEKRACKEAAVRRPERALEAPRGTVSGLTRQGSRAAHNCVRLVRAG